MALLLTTLSDEVLRARLRRAAAERMESTAPLAHARAGQTCIEVLAELRRRGVPLWREPEVACACGCQGPQRSGWQDAAGLRSLPLVQVLATG